MRRGHAGFTLIETLIAMVIVAILAAAAYPNYQEHLRKGRRANAKALLMDVAGRQERYYTANSTYADTLAKLGYGGAVQTADGSHVVSLAPDAAGYQSGFVVTAMPQARFADPVCGSLGLASTGAQTSAVSPGVGCW